MADDVTMNPSRYLTWSGFLKQSTLKVPRTIQEYGSTPDQLNEYSHVELLRAKNNEQSDFP